MSDVNSIKMQLKALIIQESEKEDILTADELTDDEPLFGNQSRLNLDSLDALQISVALKNRFGIRLQGDREVRKHMQSINTLADFIQAQS